MEEIELSWEEFTGLRKFKPTNKKYAEWLAVFGTNPQGEIFRLEYQGYNPPEVRTEIRGDSRAADQIAEALLRVRPEGGRIFVDERGAFYKNRFGHLEQFVAITVGSRT